MSLRDVLNVKQRRKILELGQLVSPRVSHVKTQTLTPTDSFKEALINMSTRERSVPLSTLPFPFADMTP